MIFGILGFLIGFITGLITIRLMLRGQSIDAVRNDRDQRTLYGLIVWGMAIGGCLIGVYGVPYLLTIIR